MNIVDREWRLRPFRHKRLTLENLVSDFQWRRASEWSILYRNRDDIVDFCAESKTLTQAIQRACRCKRPNGKHHNHQSKVKPQALRLLERRLLTWGYRFVVGAKTFADLYATVDDVKPAGIGPVTTYDVTTRVGAYLRLVPQEVYLHAGALDGYKALLTALRQPMTRERIIPRAHLPEALRPLQADHVEDFLCVYRTVFPDLV